MRVNVSTAHQPALDLLVSEIIDLGSLSPAAIRMLEIDERDHFSAHELAQAVSSDLALTSAVLRLANSAYYAFPRRISTVRDAVVLLGFRAVRSTALASCLMEAIPRTDRIDAERCWHFSVTVGMLTEVLSRATHRHAEQAFLAGVIHNIGRLALSLRHARMQEVVGLAQREGLSIAEAECQLLGFSDADVGGELARRWNFPPDLVAACEHEHAIEDGDPDSLAGYVARARRFAQSQGLTDGVETPDHNALRRPDVLREWSTPPVSLVLEQGGGLEGVVGRASVFVQHAVPVR